MRYGTWFLFQGIVTLFCLIQVIHVQSREVSHYTRVSRMTPPKDQEEAKGPIFYTRVARNVPRVYRLEDRRGLRSNAIEDFCRRTNISPLIPNQTQLDLYPKALVMDYRNRRNVMEEPSSDKDGFNSNTDSYLILRRLLCHGNERRLEPSVTMNRPPANGLNHMFDNWNMAHHEKRNGKPPADNGANQTPFLILRKYA
ncbi:hypothetical protein TCAL_01552 [Tigriopus californicus]|uniref:Uncharacterized protein n=1 Tax=Tigriopus californicus TaxID=6832 RepID=A0A553P748_TIGCA|nr:hypothetical protein TCAL_01552 [Tigriopus californicus]